MEGKVCKVCNGIACAGEVPGMGGKGKVIFIYRYRKVKKIKLI